MALTNDVLLVHGTPASDLEYFLDTVTAAGSRAATMEEATARAGPSARAGPAGASLILCGHTHVPRSVRLPDGRLVVNPGSVGLQAYADERPFYHVMATGTPHARYAVVSFEAGRWVSKQIAVPYDWDAAAAIAIANGRPGWVHPLKQGTWPETM
jgi:predicted phosphodiesterase